MKSDGNLIAAELSAYLDQRLAGLNALQWDSPGMSFGAVGVMSCSRLLGAACLLIDHDYSDVVAANIRLIYENWILGHLLMLSTRDEVGQFIAQDRTRSERAMRANNDLESLREWKIFPEGVKPDGTYDIAQKLKRKLAQDDPANSDFPMRNYDLIFRNESAMGAHPTTGSLSVYMEQVTQRIVTMPWPSLTTAESRLMAAAVMVSYFSIQAFLKLGLDTTDLSGIIDKLNSHISFNRTS